MCTAATYKTKDFYFGRTLDYEFSYGDQYLRLSVLSVLMSTGKKKKQQ
jgi:penicillin V acylase-like amidase (Ntn superfamily)